ncbi:hypothetical protein [Alicyclobacillus mengziensis]|uniref:Uncharacterized protein n=1 Tax=Alicyclobacillus mengziensis TaxID=2931921 RepID=A0A9X7VXH1_9BACL|nr:hypothetical protein [Alicyclobacillus mengziensis]QSO46272.1 hypothetical protein JZ786_17450 [Alicyclobacillus mengziensis]
MSVCQTGVPCVWGRRHADTVVCSLPRCVVYQLRTGYLDRLRGGWVKYGTFQKEVERIGVELEIEADRVPTENENGVVVGQLL